MDEEELIKLAKSKDEKAFEQLVISYKPVIERFAFQFGVEPGIIPDIVQETFIKMYRKIYQFHRGKLSTWIYQITLNVTRDFYRKQKREFNLLHKAKETQMNAQKQHGYFFEKEEHLLIHECLLELELKYKAPLILFYFHDRSYEEIAIILGLKLSVVKTRLHRGKKLLKSSYIKTGEVREVYSHG